MSGHKFPAGEKKRLDNDERRKAQPAEGIIERMETIPSEVVADLGAGTGYVAVPLAAKVSKVYALDSQQEMLDTLMERVPPELREKVVPVLGELPKLPFEDGILDRAVIVNVAHEIEDRRLLSSELRRCLRKGGRLTIVDFPKRETSFGPPVHERLTEEEMAASFPDFKKVKAWSFPEFYQIELSC